MKIGILDDERIWANQIEDKVNRFLEDKNVNYEVFKYDSFNEDLINRNLDILFLDIDLGNGEDGFAVAEKLNALNTDSLICFITSHLEFSRRGYKYKAFRYIDKDNLEDVEETIDVYIKKMIQEKYIVLAINSNELIKIRIKDIYCIETHGRKVRYVLQNGNKYITNEKLQEVGEMLKNYGLFMIQRSYVVNLRFVASYNSRDVVLLNGEKISISRKCVNDFKKAFFEWRLTSTI